MFVNRESKTLLKIVTCVHRPGIVLFRDVITSGPFSLYLKARGPTLPNADFNTWALS